MDEARLRVSKYLYKDLKTSWGVWIEVDAEAVGMYWSETAKQVSETVWLETNSLSKYDVDLFTCGLKRVAKQIDSNKKQNSAVVIRVNSLKYNSCDFQDEGLECAAACWAANEFGFPMPQIAVSYDKITNHYSFKW